MHATKENTLNSFKSKPMQDATETLQKEIRQFDPLKIIDACINQLRTYEETTDIPHTLNLLRRYPPWFLLLLIKWTFLHGSWSKLMLYKRFDSTTLGRLMNSMHDLNELARLPSQYDHPHLFLEICLSAIMVTENRRKSRFSTSKISFWHPSR